MTDLKKIAADVRSAARWIDDSCGESSEIGTELREHADTLDALAAQGPVAWINWLGEITKFSFNHAEFKKQLEYAKKSGFDLLYAAPTPAPVPVDPAELEALRRDAERYGWLRNGQSVQIFEVHEKWTSSHRLDAVIDAAKERGE